MPRLTDPIERPSVLIVTIWNGGHSNGVGIVVEELAHGVRAEGARCTVLHLVPDGPIHPIVAIDSGDVTTVQMCIRPTPPMSRLLYIPGYLFRFIVAVRAIRRLVKAQQINVAHFHYTSPAYRGVYTILRGLRIPTVLTFHGNDLGVNMREPETAAVTRTLVLATGAVTAVSKALLDTALALFPDASQKARVVHNCVPNSILLAAQAAGSKPPSGDTFQVLFVGNLIQRKGVDVLLRAFQAVNARLPTARLAIVGGGKKADELRALSSQLGLDSVVHFAGVVDRDELPSWYARAKVLAVPSRSEPFGLVVVEGQMFAVPPIASAVGGIPEIITHDETGLLVPPEDPGALAAAVLELLQDEERRQRLGRAARRHAEEAFSQSAMARRYLEVYGEVIAAAAR